MLTKEQRKLGRQSKVLNILFKDALNKKFSELQQLYDAAGINNQRLIEKLYSERCISTTHLNIIYNDIALVLAEDIVENESLASLFRELYCKRYPRVEEIYSEIEVGYLQASQNHENWRYSKKVNFNSEEASLLDYLIYSSENITEPDKLNLINFQRDIQLMQYVYYQTDKNLSDEVVCFEDGSPVFGTDIFRKYIERRKEELAKYLGITARKVAAYIHEEMKSHSGLESCPLRLGDVGRIEQETKNIIANKNGGMCWYEGITNDKGRKETSLMYRPDVESLIECYYKCYVTNKYLEQYYDVSIGESSFTKSDLYSKCKTENPANDYREILYLYELDVIYKMFFSTLEKYYHDFSWEKISKQDIITRYGKIVNELNQRITEQEKVIKNLSNEKMQLSVQMSKENDSTVVPFVMETNRLKKVIEDKQQDIDDLKRQMDIQREYIEILECPEDALPLEEDVDVEKLREKRYLFVGRIKEALPELRHIFPDSLFMNSETDRISGVKVDAIVMLTKWMSHGMFYKIKSPGMYDENKCVMCNTKNIQGILRKMYNELI